MTRSVQNQSSSLRQSVGLGTWQLGGPSTFGGRQNGWGKITEHQAVNVVRTALERGISFFDTADLYGWGRAEERLGKALKNHHGGIIICTKFGNREDSKGNAIKDFSTSWLQTSVEHSLKRLQRDHVELLLMHSPPDDFAWHQYDPSPFDALIRQGKIGAYGVSVQSPEGANRCLDAGFGSVIEGIYNVIDRRMEQEVFAKCEEKKVRFIARVPLASGFLTPRTLTQTPHFVEDDVRSALSQKEIDSRTQAVRRVKFLDNLPGGISVSAMRFCISHPAVSVVVPGARTINQVEGVVMAQKLGALESCHLEGIKSALPQLKYSDN